MAATEVDGEESESKGGGRTQAWLRKQAPEVQARYRAQSVKRNKERYATDPEFRARRKEQAAASAQRRKRLKDDESSVNEHK